MNPIFVVGTGRCGSTLISNLLNQHPDILSISEFFTFMMDFGGRITETFSERQLSGQAFWELISPVMPRTNTLVKHNIVTSEYLYPFKDQRSQFSMATGVPALSLITLPHITSAFDALYNELAIVIPQQPNGSLRSHYDRLFNWLMARFSKQVWVERSGANFIYIDQLLALYPDAHVIHIVRDGRNTALSMVKHRAFRMFMIGEQLKTALGYDPFESSRDDGIENLPPELACFMPNNFDRELFLKAEPSVSVMGELWSQQIAKGMTKLASLPANRVMTISYEALCQNPEDYLARIIQFIGVDYDQHWLKGVTSNVKLSTNSWRNLPHEQQTKLIAACAPGMKLIKQYI